MIPFSVLDLAPIPEGGTAAEALANTPRPRAPRRGLGLPAVLAGRASQHAGDRQRRHRGGDRGGGGGDADDPGRRRRHHAAEPRAADRRRGLRDAGDALSGADRPRARAGAGHRPADDAGAAALHGRRPTASRRTWSSCSATSAGPTRGAAVRAIPGEGTGVPVWILGSSLYGAQLAAHLGLPYAFASHFAPGDLEPAIAAYRAVVPAVALAGGAAADAGAQRLRGRQRRRGAAAALVDGAGLRQPADRAARGRCRGRSRTSRRRLDPMALAMAERALVCSAVGAPETVRRQIAAFVERHAPGRADPDRADPRPRGAAALVRDRRRGAGRGSARPGVGGEPGAQRVAAAGGEQHVVDAGGAVGAPGPRRGTRSSPGRPAGRAGSRRSRRCG